MTSQRSTACYHSEIHFRMSGTAGRLGVRRVSAGRHDAAMGEPNALAADMPSSIAGGIPGMSCRFGGPATVFVALDVATGNVIGATTQ